MMLLGIAGWATIIATFYLPIAPAASENAGAVPFALFLVVIVAARSMAFELLPRTVVSLDSAFYVAAAVILGSVTAGRLVALALTLDSLLRLMGTARRQRERPPYWPESFAYVMYFGGMTGALLTCSAWLFGVDALSPVTSAEEIEVLGAVFGVGLTVLVVHYALQGLRLRLMGEPMRYYVRNMAVPGVLAEASLLPLAVVVVLIYHPDQPLGFVLLGATYLLVNFVFNRLSNASGQLRKRVVELETLNVTAHRLTASLQLQEVVEAVARETVKAIPEAEVLTLTQHGLGSDNEGVLVDFYDCDADTFRRVQLDEAEGVIGWVMENNQPLLVRDFDESELDPPRLGGGEGEADEQVPRAWIGAPIEIYDRVEGVLAVQSRTRRAFGRDQRRLLESIAAQVAVALQNAQLYELAMVDGLTGLFVRRYSDARLEEEIQRTDRFGTEFSVVMMDIDNFKDLNDTYGHPVGDRVLRGLSRIVRSEMRGVDTAARYGGEEFAMILPRTVLVAAYSQAERIRVAIEEMSIEVEGEQIGVTASFGIASFTESNARDADDLVRLSDRALYRAKQMGKNRVELYWADAGKTSGHPSVRPA